MDGQDALQNFLENNGRRVAPRHARLVSRPNTKLRQDVAHLQSMLSARMSDPWVAVYNIPSRKECDDRKYFCEACTVCMPAREQDWQMHSTGLTHQCQILSLCGKGELGHMPAGDSVIVASIQQHFPRVNHGQSRQTASAGTSFTPDVVFTKQQMQYFGCQDPERLHNLQLEAMTVKHSLP